MVSDDKSAIILTLVLQQVRCLPSHTHWLFFKLPPYSWNMKFVGECLFLVFPCLVFSDLPGSVGLWFSVSLILQSSYCYFFKYFFCSISFPYGVSITHVTLFKIVPEFLYVSFCFPLCISIPEVSIHRSSRSLVLSSSIRSLLMSPTNAFLIFISVFDF